MAKCLECFHWKACFNGKDWDAAVSDPCEYFVPDAVEVVRCKDCKWFNNAGCAIRIVDDSDKPKEMDFCSFRERKDDEQR